MEAALRHFAEWAAGKQGIGDTADDVLGTVHRLVGGCPVKAGRYTVDGHVLPYLLYSVVRAMRRRTTPSWRRRFASCGTDRRR
jgi:hypothetical protein